MAKLFIAFMVINIGLFGAAIVCAFLYRKDKRGFIATTWLVWGVTAFLMLTKDTDLGSGLLLITLGPVSIPLFVVILAFMFPLFIAPIFLAATTMTIAGARYIHKWTTGGAFRMNLVFFATALIASELVVSAAIRMNAETIADGDYCLRRRSAYNMLHNSMIAEDAYTPPHATLVDGATTYTWSFRQIGFTEQTNQNFIKPNEASCLRRR